MSGANNPIETASEILSLMSKKKSLAEKLLDLTYEQKDLLEQGHVDEFLTFGQLRQEVISETNSVDELINRYPEVQETDLNYLAVSNEKENVSSVYLTQIEEVSREIKKIYLKVQQLEKQNMAAMTRQLNELKKDLASLQSNRAGQSAYEHTSNQHSGAFIDRKK